MPSNTRCCIGVDQRLVDPVGHLLGAPQPVAVARQEDPGRAVGRGVEELVLLAPWDAAAVLGHPRFDQLVVQLAQRTLAVDVGDPGRPLQRQRQPGHVVVVAVDPGSVVTQSMCADLPLDLDAPLGLRVALLGVDQAVQQMRLPPVMPAAEPSVATSRWPGHHTELGARQRPQPFQMPASDSGLRADRPVDPYLIHVCRSCPTGHARCSRVG